MLYCSRMATTALNESKLFIILVFAGAIKEKALHLQGPAYATEQENRECRLVMLKPEL